MMPRLLPRAFLWSIESLGAVPLRGSPGLPVLLVPLMEAHGWAPEVSAPLTEARGWAPEVSAPPTEAHGWVPEVSAPPTEAHGWVPEVSAPLTEARGWAPEVSVPPTEAHGWAPEVSYSLEMQSSPPAFWNLHRVNMEKALKHSSITGIKGKH